MPLTNTQYDALMRMYQARQIKNQHQASKRQQEIYEAQPALLALDHSIASISLQHARMLLNGDETALSSLKKELDGLIQTKQELLKEAGYSPDAFEPDYECPDCKDTGYINGQKCHCFLQAAIDLVYTQSNIKAILETENFDHFTLDYYSEKSDAPGVPAPREYAKHAYQESLSFIETFDTEFRNLLFYGNTGVGKTFLTHCIAKALLDTGHSVIYFTAFELFHLFEEATFRDRDNAEENYQNLFSCDLLIIDDLGTELANSFTVSQLFLCLNERILRKKSTIISTNLGLSALADTYTERTFSRIMSCYTTRKLTGDDIRITKKLKKQ